MIRLRNWDYDSLDAIIRGEVDIGFCGRESHPQSRELLSLLPWYIDFDVLFTDLPQVWLRRSSGAQGRVGSGGILTLSAYHYLLGTTRYLGPGRRAAGAGV